MSWEEARADPSVRPFVVETPDNKQLVVCLKQDKPTPTWTMLLLQNEDRVWSAHVQTPELVERLRRHPPREMRLMPARRVSWPEAEAAERGVPYTGPVEPSEWITMTEACALAAPLSFKEARERLLQAARLADVSSSAGSDRGRLMLDVVAWMLGEYQDRTGELLVYLSRLPGTRGRLPTVHYPDVRFLSSDVVRLFSLPPAAA
jgi:hypothetical protein